MTRRFPRYFEHRELPPLLLPQPQVGRRVLHARKYNARVVISTTGASYHTICRFFNTATTSQAAPIDEVEGQAPRTADASASVETCVALGGIRRSLIFPYLRVWELAALVTRDVRDILSAGKRCILRCLLQVRSCAGFCFGAPSAEDT